MPTREAIYEQVCETLIQLFEVPAERVIPEARLYEDLEIDSIDAVDLIDRVRRTTGKKVSVEDFRSVRTVGDLVTVLHRLIGDS